MIIGGGVTGIAAANFMSDFDISVHIVEKQDRLGGHAATWACMATDSCVNCGACLSIEAVEQALNRQNITVHLNTGILKIDKSENGFDVTLKSGEKFSVQKIIAATGFSPFDPQQIGSYHMDQSQKLITTATFNSLLKNDTLGDYLAGEPAPEIAFIQCVGSRNRKIGNDYCSQVCCKISMRQANKLMHINPDARITIFYMDLQVIGKEVRSFYKNLSQNIALVQGVPAEILENPDNRKLKIVTENREDMSRVAREFDMAVLSVGMEPSETMTETTAMLDLTPDSWGFFNTGQSLLAEDVYVCGCARTPTDILSAMQDGRITAGKVIAELGLSVDYAVAGEGSAKQLTVAVLGEGGQAVATAKAMAAYGYKTFLIGVDAPGIGSTNLSPMGDASIMQVSGTVGNFNIYCESGGKRHNLSCNAIIAAYEPDRVDMHPDFSSENIIGTEAFSALLSTDLDKCPNEIAILLDYYGPERKQWARMALEDALKAKSAGKNVSIIANKMLVHKAEGQRLYDKARKQGVTFLRYETPGDVRIEKTDSGIALTLKEATLPSSIDIHIECALLVLPPAIEAPADFAQKAAVLRERIDMEGFLQSPNARHRLVKSPRRGIFFVGSGHDETDFDDLKQEIEEIHTFLKTQALDMPDVDTGVTINEKMCAQCLTCYRICPHGAIILNEKMKPRIEPDACFSCHLCVANCPAYAIESETYAKTEMAEMVEKDRAVVFACERSAWLAASGTSMPENVKLVKIPCTCRMNIDVILKALLKGATKIIIAGCYEGNCRSMEGAREAALGVRQVRKIPGMDETKVVFTPIAANEPGKFARIVSKA